MLSLIFQFALSIGAIAGVYLNNHRIRFCFVIWAITNSGTAYIHITAAQGGLAFRDIVFLILAVQGWFLWGRNSQTNSPQLTQLHSKSHSLSTTEKTDNPLP